MDDTTFRVSELTSAVQVALDVCFPDEVWVQGEISSLNRSAAGHVYFQLVEPGPPGAPPVAQIAITLFAAAKATVNTILTRNGGGVRMTDGVEIRLRGRLGIYGPQGRLQLRMTSIDPAYTLGRLASERERILLALHTEGLLGRNGSLTMPVRPRRVGLVTSAGSAAEADFLHELGTSGLRWDVVAVDVRVQGAEAERAVAGALRQLAATGVDVIAVVRGGGARTDLATFDSEVVARAIALTGVPVLTGIGHEIDSSVADQVAHTACKTPTACAAHLVTRARTFHEEVDARWADVVGCATLAFDRADRGLTAHAEATARSTRGALATADAHLGEAGRRLARAATRSDDHARVRLDAVAARVATLDPQRALRRGWSITRSATGTLVRSAADVGPDDELVTTFADGRVRSRVQATELDPASSASSAASAASDPSGPTGPTGPTAGADS